MNKRMYGIAPGGRMSLDKAADRREAQHKEMVDAIFRDVFSEVYGEDGDEE